MATIIRKKLEKAANKKGFFSEIVIEQGNPYWNVQVSLYKSQNCSLDNWITSFNGRGFILRRSDAVHMLPGLVDEAMKYIAAH